MKVLVPFDGAELSEQAAVMAIEMLAQHRLELILLRVIHDERHEDAARQSLEEVAQRLGGSPAEIRPILAFGRPNERIVKCADQHGADLIAMSTHGRPFLARMLVGSVTDRMIRTSPVPVLVLHPPTMSTDRLSPPAGRKLRILAPVDGSGFSEEAVAMAVSLLRPELIDVTLVSVIDTGEDDGMAAQEILNAEAARLQERGVKVSTRIDYGDTVDKINQCAVEGGYDLVTVSTHGRGMIARMLVGSVTDRLVRTSEVPMLVIQPHSMEIPHDPVSGEDVDPDKAVYVTEYHGRSFYFRSFDHKHRFDSDPEAYLGRRLIPVGRSDSPYDGVAREPTPIPPNQPGA